MRKLLLYILLCFSGITAVYSDIRCYSCKKCATVSSKNIVSCDSTTSTSTSTSSVIANTTESSTDANSTESSTNANSTESSTDANSTESSTGANSTESSTEANSTESSTNANSTESSTNANSTVSSTEANPPNDNDNSDLIKGRFAQDYSISSERCYCSDGACDCRIRAAYSTKYQCYKYTYTENQKTYIDRGYKEIPENSTSNACNLLGVKTGCTWCSTDICNSALRIQFSIVALLSSLSITFF